MLRSTTSIARPLRSSANVTARRGYASHGPSYNAPSGYIFGEKVRPRSGMMGFRWMRARRESRIEVGLVRARGSGCGSAKSESTVGNGDDVGAGRLGRSGSGRVSCLAEGKGSSRNEGQIGILRLNWIASDVVVTPTKPVSRIPGPFADLRHLSFLATSCRTEASKGRLGVSHIPQSMYARSVD
jgi:hypothetical protein